MNNVTPRPESRIFNALTIAGLDPSGGAGMLADVKVMSALGTYACAVATGLTAQNTQEVTAVELCSPQFIKEQIEILLKDVRIDSMKTGMLGNAAIIEAIAETLQNHKPQHLVVDPVMVCKSGAHLLDASAVSSVIECLVPIATVLTPNLPEAAEMTGTTSCESIKQMYSVCEKLHNLSNRSDEHWILLKGGHLPGNEIMDLLFNGDKMIEMHDQRIDTKNTHGTGCSISAAIAALAPQTPDIPEAVKHARMYLRAAIEHSGDLEVGHGHGPLHHFHHWWRKA